MDEIKNASISINLGEGNILISGSEEFVEKNMEKVFSFIERTKGTNFTKKAETAPSKDEYIPTEFNYTQPESLNSNTDKYIKAGVYHIDADDGNISILKKIPGNSKAEKMKNIAMIVLYIRKEKIQGKEIVPICEKHSCYDAPHFASTFESEKTNLIKRGNGKAWTLELTQPGEEAVIALLEEMANDKK